MLIPVTAVIYLILNPIRLKYPLVVLAENAIYFIPRTILPTIRGNGPRLKRALNINLQTCLTLIGNVMEIKVAEIDVLAILVLKGIKFPFLRRFIRFVRMFIPHKTVLLGNGEQFVIVKINESLFNENFVNVHTS